VSGLPELDAHGTAAVRLHVARFAKKVRFTHEPPVAAYLVTLERRGVSPMATQLLVRARSRRAACDLATCIAERRRGGMFAATWARRVPAGAEMDYDDTEF
jgi:glycine cleavage system regulatory protein